MTLFFGAMFALSFLMSHVSLYVETEGLMENIQLVHQMMCNFAGDEYLIEVFSRPDGSHFARTIFSPQDVIISDGVSLEDVLLKHQDLLPLAIHSRQMPFSSRLIN